MPDARHCLAMAEEADRLAAIVSYGRDKVRLKEQAESWREKARAVVVECAPALCASQNDPNQPMGVMGWLRRRRA